MYIDKNSLIINNVNMKDYIIDVEYTYNKLWSSNTGRSLSGKMSGVLLGIFPKLVVQFKPLNQTELQTISKILDSQNQSVTYYDPYKEQNVTMTTYTGDWSVRDKNIGENSTFSVSFIATQRRA